MVGSDASRIVQIHGVKRDWQSSYVPRPEPVNPPPLPKTSPMSRINDGNGKPKISHVKGDSDVNRPLAMAGADKAHEKGIKGRASTNSAAPLAQATRSPSTLTSMGTTSTDGTILSQATILYSPTLMGSRHPRRR